MSAVSQYSLPVCLILLALTFLWYGSVYLRRSQRVREQFALPTACVLLLLTVVVLFCFLQKLTPWEAVALATYRHHTAKSLPKSPTWSEYTLVGLLYVFAGSAVLRSYGKWDGQKSKKQYQREQRGEYIALLTESGEELTRLLKRQPPSQVHREGQDYLLVEPLEPVIDSMAWKDQARDLIRLSSASYSIDSDTAWYDRESCWVGRNVGTGDSVFVFVSNVSVGNLDLEAFVRFADRLTVEKTLTQPEMIVAIREGDHPRNINYKGHSIRIETEDSLLDNLIDFSDYKNEIRKRVTHRTLPDTDFTLSDVYTAPPYYLSNLEESHEDLEDYLKKWLEEPGQRQLALLGGYGQGKSTSALMLTYNLLQNDNDPPIRIPILIELRGTSPRNLTPLQLLGAWASQYGINPQALLRLHIGGRLLLIFEGFDEMALIGDAEMRIKHFKTLWQFCYPRAKLLITGRPNFFLDEEEMKAALGISKPTGDRPYCEAIRMAPFLVSHIEKALRAYPQHVREQICSLTTRNQRFLDLVSRPCLLVSVGYLPHFGPAPISL